MILAQHGLHPVLLAEISIPREGNNCSVRWEKIPPITRWQKALRFLPTSHRLSITILGTKSFMMHRQLFSTFPSKWMRQF